MHHLLSLNVFFVFDNHSILPLIKYPLHFIYLTLEGNVNCQSGQNKIVKVII